MHWSQGLASAIEARKAPGGPQWELAPLKWQNGFLEKEHSCEAGKADLHSLRLRHAGIPERGCLGILLADEVVSAADLPKPERSQLAMTQTK